MEVDFILIMSSIISLCLQPNRLKQRGKDSNIYFQHYDKNHRSVHLVQANSVHRNQGC